MLVAQCTCTMVAEGKAFHFVEKPSARKCASDKPICINQTNLMTVIAYKLCITVTWCELLRPVCSSHIHLKSVDTHTCTHTHTHTYPLSSALEQSLKRWHRWDLEDVLQERRRKMKKSHIKMVRTGFSAPFYIVSRSFVISKRSHRCEAKKK